MTISSTNLLEAIAAMQKNLRQECIYLMINGVQPRADKIDELNDHYGYRFSENAGLCTFILRGSSVLRQEKVAETDMRMADQCIHASLAVMCAEYETLIQGQTIYGLLEVQDAEKAAGVLNDMFREIQRTFEARDSQWTLGIGKYAGGTAELLQSIFAAGHAIRFSIVEGLNRAYDGNQSRVVQENGIQIMGAAEQAHLRSVILRLDREELQQHVRKIFAQQQKQIREYPVFAFMLSLQIMQNAMQTLRDNMPVDRKTFEMEQRAEKEIDDQMTLGDLITLTEGTVLALCDRYRQFSERGTSRPVWIALNYIQEHFTEEITLADVAAEAGRNPQYISAVFSRECGFSVFDYVAMLRIDLAQKLLRETTAPVSEIAAAVGYGDAKYFSRRFSRATGSSPSEYRKIAVREHGSSQ